MKYLIAYIIIAVIFEAIYFVVSFKKGLKKFKQKPEYEQYKAFYKSLMSSASMMLLKTKIWNWYTVSFVMIPLFIFVSPFLFPSSLFSLIKKMFGYKSKLEKKAEVEEKLSEEASIKAKEWMKNEGDMNHVDEEIIINEPIVNGSLPTVEEAGVIAVGMSEHLTAQEQSFFIAGFQECIKYLAKK